MDLGEKRTGPHVDRLAGFEQGPTNGPETGFKAAVTSAEPQTRQESQRDEGARLHVGPARLVASNRVSRERTPLSAAGARATEDGSD